MAGISFSCGTFEGAEKTGSALTGVLDALGDSHVGLTGDIKAGIHDGFVLIPEATARLLLPVLVAYRARLVAEIGHDDWAKEDAAEVAAGLNAVEAKWGAGRGWRLLCATDFIRACETSVTEHQPITATIW